MKFAHLSAVILLLFAARTGPDILRADVYGQDVRPLWESGGQLRQKSCGLCDRDLHATGAWTADPHLLVR